MGIWRIRGRGNSRIAEEVKSKLREGDPDGNFTDMYSLGSIVRWVQEGDTMGFDIVATRIDMIPPQKGEHIISAAKRLPCVEATNCTKIYSSIDDFCKEVSSYFK